MQVDRPDGGYQIVRRPQSLPMVPLVNIGPCDVCNQPLMVAVGQQIRFHKECRKEGRRRFGRATHVVQVDEPAQ